ncbi:hypothetical protein [Mycobacterium angelicum]|nr:hypothetical protein [Mycobacterium angelicum]MCV7198076.1 hypothetical protein [Mycobacterium angelicum]
MKHLFIVFAVAATLLTAGCSGTSTTSASQRPTAPAPRTAHPVSYGRQVVLPFGDFINHLAGVTVDSAGDVYPLDLHYGQVWEMAVGAAKPTLLPFTDLKEPFSLAVDNKGNVYVDDGMHFRVLKLPVQ